MEEDGRGTLAVGNGPSGGNTDRQTDRHGDRGSERTNRLEADCLAGEQCDWF